MLKQKKKIMSTYSLYELTGWTGSVLLVTAYALNMFNKMRADSFNYFILNIFGSGFLLANTIYHRAVPSSVVNAIWIFFALFALSKIKHSEKKRIPS